MSNILLNDLTKIHRERMESALAGTPIAMPTGLNREQKREFILSCNTINLK